ncbi:CLUMA_CG003904, isoform A [Clunio marinus]|uniref:Nitric oxide synthase-interacting protein homolog n=1 Tax=Clunio marinus TaxID=568069 RepID=A0A1J1HUK9_9DIPT|nr:CLUMA_CG003904, isoform A [Clunio marinus]
MTRHARNSTAGSVYTYHEKKKDAATSGFGTERQRLAKHSVKNFDCCNLTLQPARIPVMTKNGYLFDKEAILEYIITKKNEYNRKLKEFEKQKQSDVKELEEIAAAENKKKLEQFVKTEKNIKVASNLPGTSGSSSLSNMAGGKKDLLPSFWIPSQTPDAAKAKLNKPDSKIYCPISGEPLKIKDLIDVKFTPANDPDDKNKSLIAKESRYVCAVTKDVLTNAQQLAVLKTTGDVVTGDCVERLIKKDWIHPLTNEKLKESDIIYLQRGGTGYSAVNQLEAKTSRPALQC